MNRDVTIFGYGLTEDKTRNKYDRVRLGHFTVKTEANCYYYKSPDIVCMKSASTSDNGPLFVLCGGDSGGPVFFEDDNGIIEQIGISIRGSHTCQPSRKTKHEPNAMLRLDNYFNWIKLHVPELN